MGATKAYVKDAGRPFQGPIYIPGETYSFYINTLISDPDFTHFRLQLRKTGQPSSVGDGALVMDNIGVLNKVVIYQGLYNIYCNFTFPSVPPGQYTLAIYSDAESIVKVQSNNIVCETPDAVNRSSYLAYRNSTNKSGFYFENLPDFYCLVRLPLFQIDEQWESDRTQYRNVTDKQLRNIVTYLNHVHRVESYYFTSKQHEAMALVYDMDMIFINDTQYIAKAGYTMDANLTSIRSKAQQDLYVVKDEFPFYPSDGSGSGGGPPSGGGGGGGTTPIVNAGVDQSLPGGTGSTSLTGTATAATGRTIVSVQWVVVDWPLSFSIPVFSAPHAYTTSISGLRSGQTYTIQFQATDDQGNIGADQMIITEAAANGITVNAGPDQELDETVSTTNLYGIVTVTGSSVLERVEWSAVSTIPTGGGYGPGDVAFSTPDNYNTGVSGIPVATTVNLATTLRLTAYDTEGNAYHDDVVILSLKPSTMFITSGWDTSRPSQQMWVYEPQGYDPARATGYPTIIFFHGMGENGDTTTPVDNINALLNETAGLPYFIYNKFYPMKSVVIMPQLHTGAWDSIQSNKALAYAQANYHIDANQFYVTGLSSGGEGTFEVTYSQPTTFAAGMPCCPISSTVGTGGGATVKDVPFMVITSYGAETGAPPNAFGNAFSAIDSICSATPLGLFPPRVICGWYTGHEPQTWNWLAYDKRRAVFDFEAFFLLHNKVYNTTVTNYVVRAEKSVNFYDWSLAMVQWYQMATSSTKTALKTRLDAVLAAISTVKGFKYTMLNLGGAAVSSIYRANGIAACTTNATYSSLVDVSGVAVPYTFKVLTNGSSTPGTDAINHWEMGMTPNMFSTYFPLGGTSWEITGLDNSKLYDFYCYCSDRGTNLKSSGIRNGAELSFNSHWTQLNFEGWNTMFTADAYGIAPISGRIAITGNALWSGTGCVNAILVRERAATSNRITTGKFNFAANNNSVDTTEYGTISTDPTLAVSYAIDPVSGWRLETIGQAPPYWKKYYDSYYSDNNVIASGTTYTPMVDIPAVVTSSGWFNDNQYFDNTTLNASNRNYNMRCVGTPGMGLPAGKYTVRIYASTTNTEGGVGRYTCKFTTGGIQQLEMNSKNNFTGHYISFTGTVAEGDYIYLSVNQPDIYGQTFINYVDVQKVEG